MTLSETQKNRLKTTHPYIDFDDPNIAETRSSGVTLWCECGKYGYDKEYHLKKCPKCGETLV